MAPGRHFDVAVIGAGSFGAWTAHFLRRAGHKVALLDQYGPGTARASSGGESCLIRMGYGPDAIYTRMAQRSLTLWRELFTRRREQLLYDTGMLWLAAEGVSELAEGKSATRSASRKLASALPGRA